MFLPPPLIQKLTNFHKKNFLNFPKIVAMLEKINKSVCLILSLQASLSLYFVIEIT